MEIFKTILWKEMWSEKKKIGQKAGVVLVLVIALYNFNMHQSLLQELMYVAYGIYLVTFFKSKNVYSNIHSLLSLPITVRELCISRSICNGIRLLIWEGLNVILLLISYGRAWNAAVSGNKIYSLIVYHIAIIQVMFVSECLLVMLGKKIMYPVSIFASILLILVQSFLYMGNWMLNLCMQAVIFCITFYIYKKLSRVENETIFVRWN